MTLAVLTVELMHVNAQKYPSVAAWIATRWDNLAVAFICGVLLCIGFPEVAEMEGVKQIIDLEGYPSVGGIIIGLSSTPLINWVKSQTRGRIKKGKKPD